MIKKFCFKCKKFKLLKEFYKDNSKKYNKSSFCKLCCSIVHHKNYIKNKNSKKFLLKKELSTKRFYKNNPNYNKNYYKTKKNKWIKYYKENKIKIDKRSKLYKKQRKRFFKNWSNKYRKNKYNNDINFRLSCNLRTRLSYMIKKKKHSYNTLDLLGCSINEFKIYIKNKFSKGMSWKNYGLKGWVLDHIRPCSSFNLSKLSEQRKCFHYSNFQPLWKLDNLKKGNKINV